MPEYESLIDCTILKRDLSTLRIHSRSYIVLICLIGLAISRFPLVGVFLT